MMLPEAMRFMDTEQDATHEYPDFVLVFPLHVSDQLVLREAKRLKDFPPDFPCDCAFDHVTQ